MNGAGALYYHSETQSPSATAAAWWYSNEAPHGAQRSSPSTLRGGSGGRGEEERAGLTAASVSGSSTTHFGRLRRPPAAASSPLSRSTTVPHTPRTSSAAATAAGVGVAEKAVPTPIPISVAPPTSSEFAALRTHLTPARQAPLQPSTFRMPTSMSQDEYATLQKLSDQYQPDAQVSDDGLSSSMMLREPVRLSSLHRRSYTSRVTSRAQLKE